MRAILHKFPFAVLLASACDPGSSLLDASNEHASSDAADIASLPDRAIAIDAVDIALPDVSGDAVSTDALRGPAFCTLGVDVPSAGPPPGFCVRQFVSPALLHEPRVLAVAPNGDVFVSAPSTSTGAGVSDGPGQIIVVSDDDHDGVGEVQTFAPDLIDVHGIAFGSDGLYFTTASGVIRTAYTFGQRSEDSASRIMMATFTNALGRWTHGLGITRGNAIYATTGVWGSSCPDPNAGSVDRMGSGSLSAVESGFRNPMYIRCHFRDEACLVDELGDDGGGGWGAREKQLAIHLGASYGYPCCAGVGSPTPGSASSDCSATMIMAEEASFPINSTPFGMDWERGIWPAPYANAVYVAFHGSFYSSPAWQGTRIAYAPTDPVTHAPNGPFQDFVTGFAGTQLMRATDVAFAADGRMFFIDDTGGGMYWVAPQSLRMP